LSANHHRPTIALLVDRLEDYYQNTILWTVDEITAEHGYNLLCFLGGVLDSPDRFARERNVIFDLINKQNADGVLVLSGTIGNEVGSEVLAEFCERYKGLPISSIAVDLKDIPSVTTDNRTGMREAVRHLIRAHDRRRIAFIRGPATNDDAQERYDVYLEELAQHGISPNPALVADGEWEPQLARQAVDTFLQHGNFDAIISASDAMAVAAIERLTELGHRVPQDVAVVSFDDDEEARLCVPPLTTVRQPLTEQVRRATQILIDQIEGRPVSDCETVHTKLVLRQSCGCPDTQIIIDDAHKGHLIEELTQAERSQARQRLQAEQWARMLSDTGEALLTGFDTASLAQALLRQLPGLSIRSCFLCLYETPEASPKMPPARAKLMLASRDNIELEIPNNQQFFDACNLLPEGFFPDRRCSLIVLPLFFEQQQMGYAMFEPGPKVGNIYEALRDQISAALQGANLIKRVVQTEEERRGLVQYILDVTPTMHRLQPLQATAESIVEQLLHVLVDQRDDDQYDAKAVDAFLAIHDDETDLTLVTTCGRFKGKEHLDNSPADALLAQRIQRVMQHGQICEENHEVIIPLRVSDVPLGVIYVSGQCVSILQPDLITLLTNQATVALQNIRLYEMATLDPLTGVHARRYFDRWLLREVRAAFRAQLPISFLMMDLDKFKDFNDHGGHLIGDAALTTMGRILRKAIRTEDIVGRYGGDEFGIVLPNTHANGAELLAQRIQGLLEEEPGFGPNGAFRLRASIGIATLVPPQMGAEQLRRSFARHYFAAVVNALIQNADEKLYQSKRAGRNRYTSGESLTWPLPSQTIDDDL